MIHTNSLLPTISIIVSNYYNVVKKKGKRKVYEDFFLDLKRIFSLQPRHILPLLAQQMIDNKLNNKVFESRDTLQRYFKDIGVSTLWKHCDLLKKEPVLWGKYFWTFIHSVSLMFIPNQGNLFDRFLILFSKILPCESCGRQFVIMLRDADSYDSNVYGFAQHVIRLHLKVNHKLKKNGLPTVSSKKTMTGSSSRSLYHYFVNMGYISKQVKEVERTKLKRIIRQERKKYEGNMKKLHINKGKGFWQKKKKKKGGCGCGQVPLTNR